MHANKTSRCGSTLEKTLAEEAAKLSPAVRCATRG
jgi:hypothetical protein